MTFMRYAVANWKMNPQSRSEAVKLFSSVSSLARAIRGVTFVICPSFVWLPVLAATSRPKTKMALGVQDVFWAEHGAFTGEVSLPMVRAFGAGYAIVGHSERRLHFQESNELVAKKLEAILRSGMHAVLCVGEVTRQGAWQQHLKEEFASALEMVTQKTIGRLIVAYEPVWAISGGGEWRADTPEDARASVIFLRRMLKDKFGEKTARSVPILYGGSVHRDNSAGFAALEEVDGVLVGQASLDPVEFIEIAKVLVRTTG